jgi:F-type H+-transporting ATPase subunit epsilon
MKLTITTPLAVVIDADDVASLVAEDSTGAFGIMPSHAPFLTALSVCVVSWCERSGRQHYCAVQRGVLVVKRGGDVNIATREAVRGDDLDRLQSDVLAHFTDELEQARTEHTEGTRLQLVAIRQMMRHLRPDGRIASVP